MSMIPCNAPILKGMKVYLRVQEGPARQRYSQGARIPETVHDSLGKSLSGPPESDDEGGDRRGIFRENLSFPEETETFVCVRKPELGEMPRCRSARY